MEDHHGELKTTSDASFEKQPGRTAAALAMVFVFTIAAAPSAQAQKYKVIHNFTGAQGAGALPRSTLIIDRAGNLYGTAGRVFKMTNTGGGWVYTPLFVFSGVYGDGSLAALAFGPDGSLYGTTDSGGDLQCSDGEGYGCGTVFNLKPTPMRPPASLTPWKETVLHAFAGRPCDGEIP